MFKKACIITLTLIAAVALSACSAIQSITGSQSSSGQSGGSGSQSGTQTSGNTGASGSQFTISAETRYAIGTLKLEGSAQAVTKEQAVTLLPLWKAMLSLSESNTSAPAEIQALQDQIKGSMTADQVNTIEKLDLSGESMRTIMSSLNLGFGNGTRSTQTAAQRQQFAAGGGGGGGRAGGGGFPGGGGGGFPGGGGAGGTGSTGTNGQTRATAVGGFANRARSAVNPIFVNAVINLLETRAGLPTSTPFFRPPTGGTPNPNGPANSTSVSGTPNPTGTPTPATSTTPGS